MRGSLVVLLALGGLVSTGCSKAKEAQPGRAAPPPTDPASRRGDAITAPGGAVTPAAGTEGATVGGSPGSTEPDPSFELAIVQPAAVAAAAPATARLVVHPGPGLKMNTDFPTGLVLSPPAGVTLPKAAFAVTDAEKFDPKELAFAVTMSAAAPGEYKVPGTFKFAVCDDGACYPKKRAVELTLTVP